MKEIADIISAYDTATAQGKRTALATVVLVEGSAYRRAGARMLITEDGQLTGAISGGCLEGDALRKAQLVLMQQQPMLVKYDTMDDDDAKLGVGLGCNGIIYILIEPINQEESNPISLLRSAIARRDDAVLVTLFSLNDRKGPQPGTCLCLTHFQMLTRKSGFIQFQDELEACAWVALASRQSSVHDCYGFTAFVECISPLISLVIVGAGNDAIPLTRIADVMGWPVTVVDGRAKYALPERFPTARRVIMAKPQRVLVELRPDKWTAFVLMTHNYNYEFNLLKELLPLDLPYIGLLGPKKKLERLMEELQDEGVPLTSKNMKTIHGPVGLDIGSETAEEIALSIIAEIKAVFSGRNGNPLKYKTSFIHAL